MVFADTSVDRTYAGALQKSYIKIFWGQDDDGGFFSCSCASDTFVSVQDDIQYFVYDSILRKDR